MTDEQMRRPRRKELTDKMVAGLPRKRKRYIKVDPELRGHYVRVPPHGPIVFAAVARYRGRQVWAKLGTADVLGIEEARDKAREAIKRIQKGLPAFEPPPVKRDSVADVAEGWLARHVTAKGLRSGDEMKRVLGKYVLPHWRDRPFAEIRRSDIATLLDHVEDRHGHWTADRVLSVLRSLSTWFATRNDGYVPPFTSRMRRTPKQVRQRKRKLNDDELRTVWQAAEGAGGFGALLQVLLLTGQRRDKVATMKVSDVIDGVWTIATEPREKPNPGTLRLPPLAMKIINAQPSLSGNPYVFTGRGKGPLSGFSSRHATFKAACGVHNFTLHDLRRTARSLLSRTSTRPDISERVLGHAVGSDVEQTYDVHDYCDEIADALAKLAKLIESIVHPTDNVVALQRAQP